MHKRQEIRKVLGGIRLVLGLEIFKKTALKTFYPKGNASSMFARDQMTTCSMESGAQSDTQNYHPAVQILSGCTGPFSIFQPVFFWGGGLFVCFTACMFTVFGYSSAFMEEKKHKQQRGNCCI